MDLQTAFRAIQEMHRLTTTPTSARRAITRALFPTLISITMDSPIVFHAMKRIDPLIMPKVSVQNAILRIIGMIDGV
jgi:hypothetical protein